MFRLITTTATLLAAATFGPYLVYSASEYWQAARSSLPSLGGQTGATGSEEVAEAQPAGSEIDSPPLTGPPVSDFGEVFRFDVSPPWVLGRWPRVVTGLAQLQLSGYRVPLVTGTHPSDLAGAMTYYFGTDQRLQRITFHGTTGDPGRLLGFLQQRFHFARQRVNDPSLFIYRAVDGQGNFVGSAELRSVWTVTADEPYRRYQVKLQLERPVEQQKGNLLSGI